jgi:hypothetical protein
MKKWWFVLLLSTCSLKVPAQSHDVQQLLLNLEKLSQFKNILQNMYDGYKVLHRGYTAIKDIAEGNFSLHKTFLDALMEVSPAVRKYRRIQDIISYQVRLVNEYKSAFAEFKEGGSFTPEEMAYFGKVYANLLKDSGESLEELALVITSGNLRMSDEERLAAIDRIHQKAEEGFFFLKTFHSNTALLSLQRKSEKADIELSRKVFGY